MYKNSSSKIIIFIAITVFLLLSQSCDKDRDRIPQVPVEFVINLNLPSYSPLKTPGNYLYVEGGSRGIILYCDGFNDYKAFDRNCPYKPYDYDAFLSVDSTSSFAIVCEGCGSRFSSRDGSILKGPAKYWLVKYSTYFDERFSNLYVSNSFLDN